ncbi:hypothetical protein HMPREF0202_00687 [Cetobacterium somerae ATCC BAA-474]|uniref:Uncharacterized protein n=1 Tax=Cetobacterium somerae ATCC BAA-474 TaxID=1319815 RepID=U7VCG7_9FUSO|nr:BREX system Lon protease-like protein BrxL [Cetobacterium somerae]ERT69417.1 hypothetical protein HMPREF0202_00687 [Cetobacterium somerae ATCC BAA-474]
MSTKDILNKIHQTIGVIPPIPLIVIMSSIVKLAPIAEPKISILLCGQRSEGKSVLYDSLGFENINILSEPITSAQLRGDAKKTSDSDKNEAIFSKDICIFEECTTLPLAIISEFKNLLTSYSYNLNKTKQTTSNLSCVFIGNSYTDIISNNDFTIDKLLSNFSAALKDEAFLSKQAALVPHYKDFLGKRNYNKIEPEHFDKFGKSLVELRPHTIDLSKIKIDDKFDSRAKGLITKLTSGIIKVMYLDKIPPNHVIDGIVEYASFFHALALGEFHNPLNSKSIKFVLEAIHGTTDDVEFVILYENRVLVKLLNKPLCLKYAINGFGVTENLLEYNFFNKNPNISIISPIIKNEHNGLILHQEFNYSPLTSKIINITGDIIPKDTDEEFNSIVIRMISNGETRKLPNFRGISNITLSLIKRQINKNFGTNISELKKSNIGISDNIGFELIAFYDYIKDKDKYIL